MTTRQLKPFIKNLRHCSDICSDYFDNFVVYLGPFLVVTACLLIGGCSISFFTLTLNFLYTETSGAYIVHCFIGFYLSLLIFFNYSMSVLSDPFVPRSVDLHADSSSADIPQTTALSAPGNHHSIPTGTIESFKTCTKCQLVKPPRAHHCSVCKRCVLKMDHHCRCWCDGV